MRPEYIELIKEYVLSKPDYKNAIQELKSNILTVGATEDELKEALRQLQVPSEVVNTLVVSEKTPQAKKFSLKNTFLFKHLVEVDIATHVALITIAMVMLAVYFLTPLFSQANNKNNGLTDARIPTSNNNSGQTVLAPQVYANTQEINPSQIFSYPPSKVTLVVTGTPKKEVFGFFPYWMLPDQSQINLTGLSTIALFGLETDAKGNMITKDTDGSVDGGWNMWNDPQLTTFIQRAQKKRIKVELTIKAFNSDNIDKLVVSDDAQRTFIANAIHLVQSKSLDGINLDFEYVGTPTQNVTDGFTRLVTNLDTALKQQFPTSTVTIDAYINSAAIPRLLDIEGLANYTDAFVIMGYDIHTPLGSPGPIAPMEGDISIIGYMQSFLDKVSPDKLILAVPYYGYDWPVPNVGGGSAATVLPYAQIADITKNADLQWDDASQTPFYQYVDPATKVTHVLHFENARSLGIKYDYVNRKNLRGIGIWALGYDGLNVDLQSLIFEKFAN